MVERALQPPEVLYSQRIKRHTTPVRQPSAAPAAGSGLRRTGRRRHAAANSQHAEAAGKLKLHPDVPFTQQRLVHQQAQPTK